MKKTYISPICEEIRIGTSMMLAVSNASLNLHTDEEENDIDNLI